MPTEMTRSWHEGYLLVQFPQLNPEPRLKANCHSAVGITLTRTLMCCQACSKTPFGWWMLPWPRQ